MSFPVSGKLIKIAAMKYAERNHINTFKASNGWLEKFQNRWNTKSRKISGESVLDERMLKIYFHDMNPKIPSISTNLDYFLSYFLIEHSHKSFQKLKAKKVKRSHQHFIWSQSNRSENASIIDRQE